MKKSILPKSFFLFAISVSAISCLTSCKNISEKAAEKIIEKSIEHAAGEDVDIDLTDETMVFESEEGRIKVDGKVKSWPSEIPNSIPEFKYGKVTALTTNESDEAKGWTLVFTDVQSDAAEKYTKDLKADGFKTQSVSMSGMGGTVSAEKDNYIVAVFAGDGEASVTIQETQ